MTQPDNNPLIIFVFNLNLGKINALDFNPVFFINSNNNFYDSINKINFFQLFELRDWGVL